MPKKKIDPKDGEIPDSQNTVKSSSKPKRRKKKTEKLVVIQDRDRDIFRILSSGPTAFVQLHDMLSKFRGYEKTTKESLWQRLSLLKSAGYICSKRYSSRNGTGVFSLYVLSPLASEILVDAGYPIGSIRKALPDKLKVSHELLVTDIVRAIKKEGSKQIYEYLIIDENMQKQAAKRNFNTLEVGKNRHKKRFRTARVFSDLFVRLVFDRKGTNEIRQYDIEVDNDTELPLYVVGKVAFLTHTTLIFCNTEKRIEALKRAFNGQAEPGVLGRTYFALHSDFCRKREGIINGFLGTYWTNSKGDHAEVLEFE